MIYYLPLEPYRERYTELLADWTLHRFAARGLSVTRIDGTPLGDGITTGRVLDAHGRAHWALTQTAALVAALEARPATAADVIYLDDMFHPGYEALPYLFDQLPSRPRILTRNFAQSVDPYDFVFPMRRWMRPYEHLVDRTVDGIICADVQHADLMRVALYEAPLYPWGLPFDADDVRRRAKGVVPWKERPRRVLYSSRLDAEKQPHFFFDLAERLRGSGIECVLTTGAATLRSTDPTVVPRAEALARAGTIHVVTGATKAVYYDLLRQSRVHFNCALQDWVSFTMLEASALAVATVAPAWRSFPHEFDHDARRLYVPWALDDAEEKVLASCAIDYPPGLLMAPSERHHAMLDTVATWMQVRPR